MRALRALLLAAVLLAACDQPPPPAPAPAPSPATPSTAQTAAPGTLRVAIEQPEGLEPQLARGTAELWIADAVFDALTRWGPGGEPLPAAAASWASPDGLVWTFTLRDGALWHDSAPVTAGDFVRGWQAVRDGPLAHLLDGVTAIDAADARTFVVRLTSPDRTLPVRAGHPALAPLRLDAPQLVGNGPFAAAEGAAPSARFLRLRRVAAAEPAPATAPGEIVFQYLDTETGFLAFQQGRVHVAAVPPGALAEAVRRYGGRVLRAPQATIYFLGIDVTTGPLRDVRVRRALSQAIDRAGLAAAVLEGNTLPALGLLPDALPETVPERCGVCAHDAEAARAAFAAAGVGELTLTVSAGGGHEEVARRLTADLAAVGVRLDVQVLAPEAWLPALRAGRARLYRFGWRPDVPTAEALLRPLLHSASVPRDAQDRGALRHNHGRYRAADVDRLLDAARVQQQPAVRAALYRRAARLAVQRDQAVVPLLQFRHRLAVAGTLQGFEPGPLGLPDWTALRLTARGSRD